MRSTWRVCSHPYSSKAYEYLPVVITNATNVEAINGKCSWSHLRNTEQDSPMEMLEVLYCTSNEIKLKSQTGVVQDPEAEAYSRAGAWQEAGSGSLRT
jgi:hypothetical protein